MRTKLITASEAARLVPSGATVAIQGSGGGVGEPTRLLRALRQRFLCEREPRDLTLYHATGLGDKRPIGTDLQIGTDLLAEPGLVRRDIAGHLAMAPRMARMIAENRIESYNLPQGVLSQLYTAIAARQPGIFTKVGLHTFVDPRIEGGKMNSRTTKDLVRLVEWEGQEWLYYPSQQIDVALVRGTTADEHGNLSCEQEPALLEGLATAQAARACGGIVIAQAKYLAKAGTLDPRLVRIPGVVVDYVVIDPEQQQTCEGEYEPAFCGDLRLPLGQLPPLPLDVRKVIARRAAQELVPGAVVNLGVGLPSGIASVATESGLIDQLTFTVEHGVVGGQPAGGLIFGVAYNPEAIIEETAQFNFYDGGGLDLAFLGMAQMDAAGNVNVSKVGAMLAGCGGFINISQSARRVVFCGTLSTKCLECAVGQGRLTIRNEGSVAKCVPAVDQITFSGEYARERRQDVLYVTERAVFRLAPEGVLLIEIAPGVDLQTDVLDRMGFRPLVAPDLHFMKADLFT